MSDVLSVPPIKMEYKGLRYQIDADLNTRDAGTAEVKCLVWNGTSIVDSKYCHRLEPDVQRIEEEIQGLHTWAREKIDSVVEKNDLLKKVMAANAEPGGVAE